MNSWPPVQKSNCCAWARTWLCSFNVRATLISRFFYSGYQSHAPFNDFFPFQKLSFGGRQSNVSMTIVVFISWQFHGHLACERRRISGCRLHRGECLLCSGRLLAVLRSVILPSIIQINARRQVSLVTINARFFPLGIWPRSLNLRRWSIEVINFSYIVFAIV